MVLRPCSADYVFFARKSIFVPYEVSQNFNVNSILLISEKLYQLRVCSSLHGLSENHRLLHKMVLRILMF